MTSPSSSSPAPSQTPLTSAHFTSDCRRATSDAAHFRSLPLTSRQTAVTPLPTSLTSRQPSRHPSRLTFPQLALTHLPVRRPTLSLLALFTAPSGSVFSAPSYIAHIQRHPPLTEPSRTTSYAAHHALTYDVVRRSRRPHLRHHSPLTTLLLATSIAAQ